MAQKEPEQLPESAKPFTTILAQLEGGALHEDLSDMVRDLSAKMSEYAANNGEAKGALTLTLSFKLDRGGVMDVVADAAVKAPKFKREKSLFWLTPGNNLSPENPRQTSLPLRSVSPAPETPRDVVPGAAVPKK